MSITVAAPPSTNDFTSEFLTAMAALTGVATDYNVGSQIRTVGESIGSVVERQGISTQALAVQTVAYSALSLFNIAPNAAVPSIGMVTFYTGSPAAQSVQIPQGTILSTKGGVQFKTIFAAVLSLGMTTIDVPVQSVLGGANANVPASAITLIVNGLAYPLGVINQFPTSGGADAQSISAALSQLAAKIASFNLASPVSIANGVIGLAAPGGGETVQYATVYEAWTTQTSGTPAAGFALYIDNGTGGASAALISAVTDLINGNITTGAVGYRPAGVPFTVNAVVPIYATVAVSGALASTANVNVVSGAIADALTSHFSTIQFGDQAFQSQIAAHVANSALGQLDGFTVALSYASTPLTSVYSVSGLPFQRIILQSASISVA